MELKPGYKLTEVGVIPENWEVKSFEKLFEFRNGVNADKIRYGQGIRFINVLEPITYSHIYGPEITGQVTLPESVATSYAVRRGDVLFNRTSETQEELGLAATYLGTERVVFGGFVIRGRPTDQSLDPIYSGYALRSPIIRSQIIPMGQGAIRANIGQQNLNLVVAPIPPETEQRLIATALYDIDALLVALDQLIAKKRDLKQAAMQQLLTGKTRLPGFGEGKGYKKTEVGLIPEDWDAKMFDDVVTGFSSGSTPSRFRPDFFKGKIVWITGGELNYQLIIDSEEKLTQEAVQKSNLRIYPPNTFVMGITGLEAEKTRGSCAITGIEATMSQQCMALLPKPGFSVRYLFHYYVAFGKNLALEYCQGTKQQSYSSRIVKILPIAVPPTVEEQRLIATVLSDMDAEITTLEQRRDKTRALKQGMMQELLTGRIRLV